jgi:hypothetical protein
MVFGAVVAVNAGSVVGFDQLEAILIEILQRLIVAIDVIENTELEGHSLPSRDSCPIVARASRRCHA